MNNNFENINCNAVKENISEIVTYLRNAKDNDIDQLVANDSVWISSSRNKLSSALNENKNSTADIITKLETFSSAMDLVAEIQNLNEQLKSTTDSAALEELKSKINRLAQEIESKLGTI